MPPPELTVVVASHRRPLRLRWLLNALWEQTLDRDRFEVIVGHDTGPETVRLLAEHPLAGAGVLRAVPAPGGAGTPGANRNRALALARAPTVVFTDDDCLPPPGWLVNVLAAVARHPGAIVQGSVVADPAETAMLRSSYPRTQHYDDVPRPWGECANIVYPRAVLERLGGFEPDWMTGEDADLLLRARRLGVPYAGDRAMVTWHAVEEGGLLSALRSATRWHDLPALVGRHPELRGHLFARVFWKDTHALLLLAAACALPLAAPARSTPSARRAGPAAARAPAMALALAGVLPYARARPWRGGGLRGRLRHLAELPGWALIDLVEIVVLTRASLRHGALLV